MKGLVKEEYLQDIANAIREKNGSTYTYKPIEMASAIRGIESGGGSGVVFMQYAKKLTNLFNTAVFPENYEVEITAPNVTDIDNVANSQSNLKKFKLNGATLTGSMYRAFYTPKTQTLVDVDFSNSIVKPTNAGGLFQNNQLLKTIIGEIDLSNITSSNNMANFSNCEALEEVRFKPLSIHYNISFSRSFNLSANTIQSIIDGLSDLTGKTPQTITFHADVKAKLTEEQISTITGKNWTLS